MTPETIDNTIDFITKYHCRNRTLRVTFYGGEALLAWDTMKKFVDRLSANIIDTDIEFGISTNGYLLEHEVVDWICALPACRVYLSLDGDESTHNANRITVKGEGTYNKIIANLKYFAEKYPERYANSVDFLVTLATYNQLVAISDFMRHDPFLSGKIPIHLSFLLPRNAEERRISKVRLTEFKAMLETAYNRYQQGEKSLLVNKFIEWTNIFESSRSEDITVTSCAEDMYRLFISTEGQVYLCERFDRRFILGMVNGDCDDIVTQAIELESQFIGRRNRLCRHCDVASWCTMCMTSLNYTDRELAELCMKERAILPIVRDYARRRRFKLN